MSTKQNIAFIIFCIVAILLPIYMDNYFASIIRVEGSFDTESRTTIRRAMQAAWIILWLIIIAAVYRRKN